MKKTYIKPEIEVEEIEQDSMLTNSSTNDKDKKPGWGPDKDSDGDGHHRPPGQDKHNLDEWFEDDSFYV